MSVPSALVGQSPPIIERVYASYGGTIGTTPTQIGATKDNRGNSMLLTICGAGTIYIGFDNTVSTTKFYQSMTTSGTKVELDVGAQVPVWIVADAASRNFSAVWVEKKVKSSQGRQMQPSATPA